MNFNTNTELGVRLYTQYLSVGEIGITTHITTEKPKGIIQTHQTSTSVDKMWS